MDAGIWAGMRVQDHQYYTVPHILPATLNHTLFICCPPPLPPLTPTQRQPTAALAHHICSPPLPGHWRYAVFLRPSGGLLSAFKVYLCHRRHFLQGIFVYISSRQQQPNQDKRKIEKNIRVRPIQIQIERSNVRRFTAWNHVHATCRHRLVSHGRHNLFVLLRRCLPQLLHHGQRRPRLRVDSQQWQRSSPLDPS